MSARREDNPRHIIDLTGESIVPEADEDVNQVQVVQRQEPRRKRPHPTTNASTAMPEGKKWQANHETYLTKTTETKTTEQIKKGKTYLGIGLMRYGQLTSYSRPSCSDL